MIRSGLVFRISLMAWFCTWFHIAGVTLSVGSLSTSKQSARGAFCSEPTTVSREPVTGSYALGILHKFCVVMDIQNHDQVSFQRLLNHFIDPLKKPRSIVNGAFSAA